MNTPDDLLASRCISAIRDFADASRPRFHLTFGVAQSELLEAEQRLNDRWNDFESLTERGWATIREQMSRGEETSLWHYAIRMAEMAVRTQDETLIRYGLMALVVMDIASDPRDIFTGLALLLDAAKRINASLGSTFSRAAELATPEMRETIRRYIAKRGGETSMDHVLRGLGYGVSGSGESFKYRSIDDW